MPPGFKEALYLSDKSKSYCLKQTLSQAGSCLYIHCVWSRETVHSISGLLSGLVNFLLISSLKSTYFKKCVQDLLKICPSDAMSDWPTFGQLSNCPKVRKLLVIGAVNTHAYLIHPRGSAWYQRFCFTFIKIPIRTQNAEHHPKQNQTKPTHQKKEEKEKKLRHRYSNVGWWRNTTNHLYILL